MKLNLGSGRAKLEGYVNIDMNPDMNPDVLCNIVEGLPFSDSSIDEVRAYDFLEHIPPGRTVIEVINEIWRVLKPGGLFISSTPDAEYGMAAFQDPTHISFWVENSWDYYSKPAFRDLYGTIANFKIEELKRHPPLETNSRMYWIQVQAIAIKE